MAPAQLDSAIAARDTASGQVEAAKKRLQAARLGGRADQIAAADERVRQAEAAVEGARAQLDDQAQTAPVAGRIEEVFFQPGEWTPANQPVLSLIPDDRVRIRFFAPEAEVANYAVGREVAFACDSCPQGLRARINYVSPRPEFTPPVIYSRESRDRMVFMIEATPLGDAKLTPGLPVDVAPLGAAAE
ncbi:MAG: HlyD family efflux transporter periplasmic adaptor subunit [Hyphomonadaceae bacterium]